MRRLALLLALLALSAASAGCLSPGGAAEVSDSALRSEGWKKAGSQDNSAAAGLAQFHIREYQPSGIIGNFGRIILVTAPDVPLVDENKFVDEEMRKILQREGMSLENPSDSTLTLQSGVEVGQTVYDVKKSGLGAAKLRKATWTCDGGAFVAAIGYGVMDGTFEQTGRLVKSIACP